MSLCTGPKREYAIEDEDNSLNNVNDKNKDK